MQSNCPAPAVSPSGAFSVFDHNDDDDDDIPILWIRSDQDDVVASACGASICASDRSAVWP